MKVKWNRTSAVLALLLTVMILMVACGDSNENNSNTSDGNSVKSGSSNMEGDKSSKLEPYELTVAYWNIGNTKDLAAVAAEVNKLTQAKINTTIKFMPIDIGAWQQQMNLMLAGNEKLDLLITAAGMNYGTQAAKGQLLPLDDLLEKYGKDIKTVVGPDILKATMTNGKIYGVPSVRDWAADYGVLMRKDLVDKYKIDLSKIKTYEDMESVFKIIKEKEPMMAAILPEGTSGSIISSITPGLVDPLNDENGVLPGFDNGLKVVNWYESQQYADMLNMVRKWYLAGYIPKDISTNQTPSEQLVKAGKAFSFVVHMKPGYENKESLMTGTPMVSVRLLPPVATTSTISNVMFSIAKNSKNPERAMMFLNMLYTDKDLVNLIDYGIEGKHYVKKTDTVIDYPSGIDSASATYAPTHGWMWGNQFLSYVWNGDDPNIWKLQDEFNKSAMKSKAMGFSFTVDPVKTETAAVQSVKEEYKVGLETGTLDPAKYLPEFIGKLKSAGIEKIIAEKQKQLDEWAKSNQ